MPETDRRIHPQSVSDGYPDPGDGSTSALSQGQEERRVAKRRAADKLGGYSMSMRAKAAWIKDFMEP